MRTFTGTTRTQLHILTQSHLQTKKKSHDQIWLTVTFSFLFNYRKVFYFRWTPVHPRLLSIPEISQYLAQIWCGSVLYIQSTRKFRRNHPYQVTVCILFVYLLGILGWIIPFIRKKGSQFLLEAVQGSSLSNWRWSTVPNVYNYVLEEVLPDWSCTMMFETYS